MSERSTVEPEHAGSRPPGGRPLLARLLRPRPAGSGVPVPRQRANPDAVVDCAVYLDGRRQPGRPHFADAYAAARRRPHGFVWLGLRDPDVSVMTSVARIFGLHDLAIEQALNDGHRPVIERQGATTLLVARTAQYVEHAELTATSEVVDTGDVMMLLGHRFVITIRHGPAGALGSVRRELERQPTVLAEGPWAVAYAVCAQMVDLYLDVAGQVEKDMERLEESVFARHRGPEVQQLYQVKRELVEFKRAVVPLQPALRSLVEERGGDVPPVLRRYFVEVDARLARTVERVSAFDDLLNSLLQARLAQVAVDQNNDMRKIASWAAIAAVQTAIAGIYGMNFDHMPELHWVLGYPGALGLMALAALGLHRLFRRSGWL